jgi:ubiquinone/menaquinone biosynthesis C-methylase UbiE
MNPTVIGSNDVVSSERARIQAEYRRRREVLPTDLYAPWQRACILGRDDRELRAAIMLHRAGKFPRRGEPCLEIGFGGMGWLSTLINWGVRETDLHGIDLDQERVARVRESLPAADLRIGDASHLPWPDGSFRLVITSMVFTSILNLEVRRLVAEEVTRVLAPGAALLWYDFTYNNPSNPNVRKVTRGELADLFPSLKGEVQTATLAAPLARRAAPISILLTHILTSIPLLRTHLLSVLVKV